MPKYEYRCTRDSCGNRSTTRIRLVSERDAPIWCFDCGAPLARVFSRGIVLQDGGHNRADLEHPEVVKTRKRNKEYYESRAPDIRSGALKLEYPRSRIRSDDPTHTKRVF